MVLAGKIKRLKKRKGYSVHSPFVYSLVRNVLMKKELVGVDSGLYKELINRGATKRLAIRLQNYFTFFEYNKCEIDLFGAEICDRTLCVVSKQNDGTEIDKLTNMIGNQKVTLAILSPNFNGERKYMWRKLVENHHSISIDTSGVVFLFYDNLKAKQHIKL